MRRGDSAADGTEKQNEDSCRRRRRRRRRIGSWNGTRITLLYVYLFCVLSLCCTYVGGVEISVSPQQNCNDADRRCGTQHHQPCCSIGAALANAESGDVLLLQGTFCLGDDPNVPYRLDGGLDLTLRGVGPTPIGASLQMGKLTRAFEVFGNRSQVIHRFENLAFVEGYAVPHALAASPPARPLLEHSSRAQPQSQLYHLLSGAQRSKRAFSQSFATLSSSSSSSSS
eukprot:CAMPEP_0177661124 /NCGR_PEP_ID=MMETSP0447-20121125/18476_1 /TAXON_ID=0 /ORGANISM="Stygamoeba regulata, Strain BSH-02190019" /LENGTH=226 /DNA_ID=CAMNT_0019166375 /DNA_START=124 /DNA_END=800 /DNA_ORIENTATION=+